MPIEGNVNPAATPRVSMLAHSIAEAFGRVTLDGGVTLRQARAMDDHQMSAEQAASFAGNGHERWTEVLDDELREHNDVLPLLCPKAFRFYIPAFMLWTLRHLALGDVDSGLSGSTILSFRLGEPSDSWYADQMRRFDLLSAAQKACVCNFLGYLVERDDSYRSYAEEFLSSYWSRFCEEAKITG